MKQNRCCLCEGRVVNGICIECGMHNGKSEKEYLLNKSSCDSQPLTHVHKETSESTGAYTSVDRTRQEETKERIRHQMQEKREQRQQKQQKRAEQGWKQSASGGRTWHSYGPERKKGKSRIWIFVAVFIVIIGILADNIGDIFDMISYRIADLGIIESPVAGEDTYEYDPYEYLERELAPEGDHYEQVFAAGNYVVGLDLPEGQYTARVQENQGSIHVSDWENSIYLWESLGDGEYEEDLTEVADLRLFDGAHVEISGGVSVLLTSENAQTEQMHPGLDNPLTESVTLEEGTHTAGTDFAEGTYDIQLAAGSGSVELKYMEEDGEEYYVKSFYLDTDSSQKYDPSAVKYVVIPEGYYLTVSGSPLTLVPSDRIISEDYISYYGY